jgi:hypothetical protein
LVVPKSIPIIFPILISSFQIYFKICLFNFHGTVYCNHHAKFNIFRKNLKNKDLSQNQYKER